MAWLTTVLSFVTTFLKALVPIGAYMLGRKSVEKDQLEESLDAASKAKGIREEVSLLPESELDDRLSKYTRK